MHGVEPQKQRGIGAEVQPRRSEGGRDVVGHLLQTIPCKLDVDMCGQRSRRRGRHVPEGEAALDVVTDPDDRRDSGQPQHEPAGDSEDDVALADAQHPPVHRCAHGCALGGEDVRAEMEGVRLVETGLACGGDAALPMASYWKRHR